MTCKVLLIEDDPIDAATLKTMLAASGQFVVARVETLEDALAQLDAEPCDILLADMNLPDSWGLATYSRLQAQVPNLPIVVMSGIEDEEVAVRNLQVGAQDYLIKGQIDSRVLGRTLRYALERKRAEIEREHLIGELRDALAHVKTLTELMPICAWCKKIRNDQGYWDEVESYFAKNLDAQFTHGICPDCVKKEMTRLEQTPPPRSVLSASVAPVK